jgi:hypothetical protein
VVDLDGARRVRLVDEGDLCVSGRHELGASQGADVPEQLQDILLRGRSGLGFTRQVTCVTDVWRFCMTILVPCSGETPRPPLSSLAAMVRPSASSRPPALRPASLHT